MGRDFFRETKFRYLGYANEVGEALRPVIDRKYVHYSYGIAFGYVIADTIDKGLSTLLNDGRPGKVIWATGDAFVWQSLASIIVPGLTVNRIVHHSEKNLARFLPKVPPQRRAWAAVGIGLASIPIICQPIDLACHWVMNLTYRQLFPST